MSKGEREFPYASSPLNPKFERTFVRSRMSHRTSRAKGHEEYTPNFLRPIRQG